MVRGKQNKVIAYDLDISPRTVEVHRARVLEKLEARSLSELVRLALAAGVPISS
jgi:two-component system response regulator FixJ